MGNTQRLQQTLLESFDVQTGEFDPQLYFIAKHYRRRRAARRDIVDIIQGLSEMIDQDDEDDEEISSINSKRKRGPYQKKDPPKYRYQSVPTGKYAVVSGLRRISEDEFKGLLQKISSQIQDVVWVGFEAFRRSERSSNF